MAPIRKMLNLALVGSAALCGLFLQGCGKDCDLAADASPEDAEKCYECLDGEGFGYLNLATLDAAALGDLDLDGACDACGCSDDLKTVFETAVTAATTAAR